MKRLIALVALAGLFAVGCAHRDKNMGGDQDNSSMSTGSQKYQSNPSSSSSSSSSWSDTNSASNPSSTTTSTNSPNPQ